MHQPAKCGMTHIPSNITQIVLSPMKRPRIPYDRALKERARELRNHSTVTEVMLWQRLKKGQMLGYDFHRQKPVDRYIVDFFCHELMLAIEIDGSSHATKKEYDARRQRRIESFGITFLRFPDADVRFRIDDVLSVIAAWIKEKEGERG